MSSNGVKPFENNWAYLKTELRWLDRILMVAVARKRQDDKSLQRVANSPADHVSSHWWKGLITVSRGIDDREGPPPKRQPQTATNTASYSYQLQLRIRASHQAGTVLALPLLRDRLKLSEVEKNIVLMAIAPEINRRYGRLYDFLQDEEGALADLPTVDLCLRLLCRDDHHWQHARARLTATQSLTERGLLEWVGDEEGTLLSQQVRVSDDLTRFLLADRPTSEGLNQLIEPIDGQAARPLDSHETSSLLRSPTAGTLSLETATPSTAGGETETVPSETAAIAPAWDHLVLPKKLLRQLQYIARQAPLRHRQTDVSGLMTLLVGAPGTGKTLAAATIAAQLQMPLTCIELATLSPEAYPPILTQSPAETSSLLLIKQAERWFGRKPEVEEAWLHQWWQWRQQFGLTLIAVTVPDSIRPHWRQKFDTVFTLPRPDAKARQRLWQQSFAPDTKIHKLDWAAIAQQLPLTGGEIHAIAQTAELDLQTRQRSTLTITALRAALALHRPDLRLASALNRGPYSK